MFTDDVECLPDDSMEGPLLLVEEFSKPELYVPLGHHFFLQLKRRKELVEIILLFHDS